MRHSPSGTRGRLVVAVLVMTLSTGRTLGAQRAEPPQCLRFRFGAWTPALDWSQAGHPGTPDSFRVARAEQGQAWAAGLPPTPRTAQGDTLLMLFPAFWPVGVMVTFDPRAFAGSDTVVARATALVADGRRANPLSDARVWRVPCS